MRNVSDHIQKPVALQSRDQSWAVLHDRGWSGYSPVVYTTRNDFTTDAVTSCHLQRPAFELYRPYL